jgi:hypothetical protein
MKIPQLLFILLVLSCTLVNSTSSIYTSDEVKINSGAYRYHFDQDISNSGEDVCQNINIIGVGTAMSITDYDLISSKISAGKAIVTIIVNPILWSPVKSDTIPLLFWWTIQYYVDFYNDMMASIGDNIPVCNNKHPTIFVGGHSASGRSFIKALPKMDPQPKGFIGLDPFNITPDLTIDDSIYTLDWGFSSTTCSVTIDEAAKEAYGISSKKHRVFYRMNNDSFDINHCVFTDSGSCFDFVCSEGKDGGWVLDAVATSIHTFIDVINAGSFDGNRDQFVLTNVNANLYDLFVNEEEVTSSYLVQSYQ